MRKLAFALGVLVLGVGAVTQASADYAVVTWKSGYCRVWGESQYGPQDGKYRWYYRHHHKGVHYRFKTWDRADKAMHRSVAHKRCQHWW
jgi:hypothetical protein